MTASEADVLDDPAVGGATTLAGARCLGLEGGELVAQRLHLSDTAVEVGDLAAKHAGHVVARLLAPIAKSDDLADLVEAEAEALRGLDEGQPLGVVVGVVAVAGWGPNRIRHEPDRLVEADGLGRDSEPVGKLTDLHDGTVALDLPLGWKVYGPAMTKRVEIFSAGCPTCQRTIEQLRDQIDERHEIVVHDMSDERAAAEAERLGIRTVPAVAVDGALLACCDNKGPSAQALQAAGLLA